MWIRRSLPEWMFGADVVGYDLDPSGLPEVLFRPTPDPEPFPTFAQRYAEGDTVPVIVTEHDTYPGDHLVALVVQEPGTKTGGGD